MYNQPIITPGSEPKREEPQVERKMRALENTIKRINDLALYLAENLKPVLRPAPELQGGGEIPAEANLCPLAEKIESYTVELSKAEALLVNIKGGLQI